jgi:cyclopropane fatty-acyl-phospholipid synthase-like methyltransferase
VREYDEIAEWYTSNPRHPVGVPEVAALAATLPSGSRVLDIGCGNGLPITGALVSAGHRVVGLDSSREMLARFRGHLPATPVVRGIVQACAFASNVFDAAVAWGVIFHLTYADQARAFASVSRVLKAGAPFLFTAGEVDDADGGITGTMNGVTFHYYSFSVDGYWTLLQQHGFALLDVHKDAGENTYYLCRRSHAETQFQPPERV